MILVGVCELHRGTDQAPGETGRRWIVNGALYAVGEAIRFGLAPLITALLRWVAGASPFSAVIGLTPWWGRLILSLLVLDAAAYWLHRASHRIAPLWRLHAVHHSDRALDVTTTIRHHPVEIIPSGLLVGGVGALLGLTPWDVAIYTTLSFTVQLVGHAELRLPRSLMRTVGLLLITPDMHYLHHSRLEHETDTNYGQMFSIWDRLFGTFTRREPTAPEKVEFGLDQYADDRFHSFRGVLLQPFVRPTFRPTPGG